MADLTAAVAASHLKAPHQTGFSAREPRRKAPSTVGVGGVTPTFIKKFDPALHPRGEDGRFIEATQPRIFNRPSEIEQIKGWPGEPTRFGWKDPQTGQVTGHLLTGLPLSREQLPETLYHVTTNAPAVESSGVLLGLLESGGLGGGQAKGVSFTTSKEDATVIQRELKRAVQIARGDVQIDDLEQWAHDDAKEAGLAEDAVIRAYKEAKQSYDGNKFSLDKTFVWDDKLPDEQRGWKGPPPPPEERERLRRGLIKDAFNAYLMSRGIDFGDKYPLLKNPLLFGRQEQLAKLKPENVQTLEIPSAQIPEGALVTTGSDDFLHEVRAYSDVPLRHKKVQSVAKFAWALKFDTHQPRDPKGTSTGGQWSKTAGRTFTSEEGYQWHEKGPVAEWAKQVPYNLQKAIESYAGFGYRQINEQLRGTLKPRLEPETLRPATPEEVAKAKEFSYTDEWFKQFGMTAEEYRQKFGYTTIMSDKPGPPEDPYHRLLDPEGKYVGHVMHIPYTSSDDPKNYVIQRMAPDYKPLQDAQKKADEINTLIRDKGYELPEAIQVERGAYLPGVTFEQLQNMQYEGPHGEPPATWEEKGFTSTMVGDAKGRAKSYPALGKTESLYQRYESSMYQHQDEEGTAIRFHITLPAGTKVASVEALRRMDYEFPRIPDPSPRPPNIEPQYWTMRDYSATPKVDASRLEDTSQRSESELLLGSGAKFRVTKVLPGSTYHFNDPQVHDIPITEMYLDYVGGGSSEGRKK